MKEVESEGLVLLLGQRHMLEIYSFGGEDGQ